MYGDDRVNQDDVTRLAGRERPDTGVRPIGDVLAELLSRQFPELNEIVVEELSAAN